MPLTDQEKIKAYEEAVEEISTMDVADFRMEMGPKNYDLSTDINSIYEYRNQMNDNWRTQRNSILTKLDERLKGV